MLTGKQETFCKQYVLIGNAAQAYKIAYKQKNAGTCKANASRLLKRSDIAKRVDELQRVAKSISNKKAKEVIESAVVGDVMDIKERQYILSQIARGEIVLKKPMVVDKTIVEIDTVPDWTDRRNAIAELNKMDGSYAPSKVAQTDTDGNDVPPTSIKINIRGTKP